MLISKIGKSKKVVGLACASLVVGGALASMPVHAASTSTTPVSYDNRQVVDVDGNGKWGVIVPTAIAFTDANKGGVTGAVEVTGINGYKLEDFKTLTVTSTLASAGTYKLQGEGTATGSTVAYSYDIDGKTFDAAQTDNNLTEMNLTKTKLDGTAKLTGEAPKKGTYKDTLTFSFTGTSTLK
ncbi:hypothetical protein [Eubacterium sp.]|uniref:hypothetical protein n=1 Tax=Eubacterium sp. TaxID=142586 RepID=UPI002FC76D70